ncbi:MAG: 30S ribosomal protein S15 [Desulfurella sp.]|jgi:small subunit ribosomal protein S15|uniref:Small ribosomal subunit protein uS15 n=1 Tax=Desulfurella multipotens TaxID=79269 RepID=A0A1G6I6B2_9BACT|nr:MULTISPECIES: 30S ribosomal protein S15 [Desulfurella]AHF97446.1 30S ribosomal protein S15 [Desulfurella acetivorans A63]PMP67290.1 MAG: 30S ribosomal protein S15 [Desulfurella multipotens]PMP92119.1 MAG: 30S ribosomal protein S15 [Desulfurella sp.]SDC02072.1 small subunit ribosomal protein S15 [Desulfurella multipotens]
MLTKEQKQEIIKRFGANEKDSGSVVVQIALLTERINYLTEHLKNYKKDFQTRRGLLRLVNQRRRLLKYLEKHNFSEFKKVVKELGLRVKGQI